MWGVFAGISLWIVLYPMIDEWREHRADKRRLADMRRHFALGHRWDVLQGRWMDN
jgi:hypothetical protein